jgi:hypothetical protein
MRRVRGTTYRSIALAALAAGALAVAGCGDDDSDASGEGAQPAPAAADFPAPDGRNLEELYAASNPTDDLVVSPAGAVFTQGRNRLGFGVFTVAENEQITDADVAIYAAHGPDGEVQGPFPARIESLETETAFTAKTTADDPDAAKVVYVTDVVFDAPGEWRLIALVRQDSEVQATRIPSIVVGRNDAVPAPGEPAPPVHTPTTDDVADVAEIDTRVPPSTLHEDDLADVLGKEPVVLLFATPALCQSRVCGPVVDVTEQVKNEHRDDAAFIQMEIYEDNDPNKGLRPQVRAYNLQTEPWLFVIDDKGRVSSRIEGAFSVAELEQALEGVGV